MCIFYSDCARVYRNLRGIHGNRKAGHSIEKVKLYMQINDSGILNGDNIGGVVTQYDPRVVKTAGSWNYYRIDGKNIISIAFYDAQGIKVQSRSGILETAGYSSIRQFTLNKPPVRKLKVDLAALYSTRQPFIYNDKTTYAGVTNYGYVLYIPFEPADWTTEEKFIETGDHADKYVDWANEKIGCNISVYVGSFTINENKEFIDKVRKIAKLFVYEDRAISDTSIIKHRKEIEESIKTFGIQK